MEILGTRLRDLREEKKMSQKQLAEKFNVSHNSISKWEIGIHEPDLKTLVMIADFFGVTTDYLLGRVDI